MLPFVFFVSNSLRKTTALFFFYFAELGVKPQQKCSYER